jgi:hypothetical protein
VTSSGIGAELNVAEVWAIVREKDLLVWVLTHRAQDTLKLFLHHESVRSTTRLFTQSKITSLTRKSRFSNRSSRRSDRTSHTPPEID